MYHTISMGYLPVIKEVLANFHFGGNMIYKWR